MVSIETYRKLAMSFPEAVELPHFEKTSFRVNKKIFSTLSEKENIVMVKLSLVDQSVFCDMIDRAFYPVSGAWGKQGATYIDLKKVKSKILEEALTISYCNVALKKLVESISNKRK